MSTKSEQQAIVDKQRAYFRDRALKGVRETQIETSIRSPVRGGIWISQDAFTAPQEDDLLNAVYDVIEANQSSEMIITPRNSISLAKVPLEWIGQRKNAGPKDLQPQISDQAVYHHLCRDLESPMTILYAHGGGFYTGSPASVRGTTTRIAKMSRARVVSAGYRLAPQNTFPAALLDLFTAWMSLIYPAADARHAPVDPSSVVIAGDSAGGALVLAMIQAILQMRSLRKSGTRVIFNGKIREIPLPSGIALQSACVDYAFVFPSFVGNAHIDVLGPIQPALRCHQPSDEIWPTNPPRGDIYSDPSTWPHPLISPVAAKSWEGCPPLWFNVGEEQCADAVKALATLAANQGVPVVFSEYLACTSGSKIENKGERIHLPGDRKESIDVTQISNFPREEIVPKMKAAAR